MTKKFENKKLNKEDHANIDKKAGAVRTVTESIGALAFIGVVIKKVPWKDVGRTISKVVSRG